MDDRDVVINELVERIESALAVDSDYVCVRTDLLQTVVGLLKKHGDEIEQLNRFVNGFSRDAMPVVRCKDCISFYKNDNMFNTNAQKWMRCKASSIDPDWFCADGERKKGGEVNDLE